MVLSRGSLQDKLVVMGNSVESSYILSHLFDATAVTDPVAFVAVNHVLTAPGNKEGSACHGNILPCFT